VRRVAIVVVPFAVVAFAGCQLLAGLEDRRAGGLSDANAEPDAEDDSSDTGPSCERCGGAACVDLATDSKNCGRCGRDCHGGACSASQCPIVDVAWNADGGLGAIDHLTVDQTHLYFSTATGIVRLPKDGGALESVVARTAVRAIAVSAGVVYYARLPTAPTEVDVEAISGQGGDASLVAAFTSTLDASPPSVTMALDPPTIALSNGFGIVSVLVDGGSPSTLLSESTATTIVRLGADPTDLYFLDVKLGSPSITNLRRVSRTAPDAGATSLMAAFGVPGGLAIDKGNVFWSDRVWVYRSSTDGGAQTRLAQTEAYGLVTRGDELYWILIAAAGQVTVIPQVGGEPLILASGISWPKNLAVDDAWVYFDDDDKSGGRVIRKVAR
jgi:hypothetical protein